MTDTSQPEGSSNSPATEAPPPPPAPAEDPLAAARREATANHDRYLRAVADLENYRKRTIREKDELRQMATAAVIEDIIPIIDNLSLGLAAARQQTDVKSVADGITMVLEQFKSTLARQGLKEINPIGAAFDPHLQECISHEPSATVASEKVIKVVRLGYQLNNRLIRPASVIVSSGPAAEAKG
ncbi:MAG TPA: nucleotide exchange factor GrpE [Candidatus Didemnitutus sp.]|nr:nucleotide exchange factor GrpE [Candidatus Didemnitutus sp.]